MKWKKIEGYENYSVSDTGLVMNTRTGRILAFAKDKDGYLSAGIPKNGKVQKFRVHRLVAQAFIPNPNCLATVDHKNGNKEDNNASNLQWLSYGDNLEKYWEKHRKPVVCLESGVVYPSAYRAAAELGLMQPHITEVCNKKRKHEKHLHFEYLQEKTVC
jgi:hypothetical protein